MFPLSVLLRNNLPGYETSWARQCLLTLACKRVARHVTNRQCLKTVRIHWQFDSTIVVCEYILSIRQLTTPTFSDDKFKSSLLGHSYPLHNGTKYTRITKMFQSTLTWICRYIIHIYFEMTAMRMKCSRPEFHAHNTLHQVWNTNSLGYVLQS